MGGRGDPRHPPDRPGVRVGRGEDPGTQPTPPAGVPRSDRGVAMSPDALSHLVQRTLQPEPAVGPRLPSRYEGRRGGPDTEIERDVEVTSPPPAAYRPSTNAEEPASGSPRADASY